MDLKTCQTQNPSLTLELHTKIFKLNKNIKNGQI